MSLQKCSTQPGLFVAASVPPKCAHVCQWQLVSEKKILYAAWFCLRQPIPRNSQFAARLVCDSLYPNKWPYAARFCLWQSASPKKFQARFCLRQPASLKRCSVHPGLLEAANVAQKCIVQLGFACGSQRSIKFAVSSKICLRQPAYPTM